MSLQNWLQIGHLNNHQATVAEVRSLLGIVDRELADAAVAGLSDDGRFTHAYEAALCSANSPSTPGALNWRKGEKGHHSLWINSLEFTLGPCTNQL